MTQLNKPIKRSLSGLLRKPLIVTLYPGGLIGFRESRSRREYRLPVISCYNLAITLQRELDKKAKKNRKEMK